MYLHCYWLNSFALLVMNLAAVIDVFLGFPFCTICLVGCYINC